MTCRVARWSILNALSTAPGKPARVSVRTFRPIAFRSVRAKSYDPSNPMFPPSKKASNNEDREFQGRSDGNLRPGDKCRHHRRRQAAEGLANPEGVARKGITRHPESAAKRTSRLRIRRNRAAADGSRSGQDLLHWRQLRDASRRERPS